MKSHYLPLAFVVAAGLALAGSIQAQPVTGTPYLSNIDPVTLNTPPSALYASWYGDPNIFSTPTGLEIQASGYGSGYYVLPGNQVQTINASATEVQLSFTVAGNAADYNWVGTPFILNDDSGSYTYGGYSGSGNPGNPSTVSWSGNTATWTLPIQSGELAAIAGGNDHVYSFNLEFDPATLINGRTSYDVTFNSLTFITVPEPVSITLLGLGAAALLLRRQIISKS